MPVIGSRLIGEYVPVLHQAAMVVDIRFQQLISEKAHLKSISVPQPEAMPMMPPGLSIEIPQSQATLSYPLSFPQPHVAEPFTLASSHVPRLPAISSPARFVLMTSFLSSPYVIMIQIIFPPCSTTSLLWT